MKMKRILLLLVVLHLLTSSVHAQNRHTISPTDWEHHDMYLADECQKNAEFVFEGRAIAIRMYKYDSTTTLWSGIIRITKIYKGNLHLGTIELIDKLSSEIFIPEGEPIEQYWEPSDTCSQLFFCEVSNLYPHDVNSTGYKINNSMIVDHCFKSFEASSAYQIHDSKCNDGRFGLIRGFDSTFVSRASFYNYLRNDYHITIPVSAEELSDTIPGEAYQSYLSWYRRDVLHIPEPSDSEKAVIRKQLFALYSDSIDSAGESHFFIIKKMNTDNYFKDLGSPLYYEYYWDGSIRCFIGRVVDPRRRRQTR